MEKELTVKLDVEAITREAIEAQVHREIFEDGHTDELLRKTIAAQVEKLVASVAQDEVRKRIAAAIDDVFATGWHKTDSFGRAEGGAKTVRDLILEFLTARDRYSSDGQWIERTTREQFNVVFMKEINPEIVKAKQVFKEMLDTTIRDRLALAIREAMGLK